MWWFCCEDIKTSGERSLRSILPLQGNLPEVWGFDRSGQLKSCVLTKLDKFSMIRGLIQASLTGTSFSYRKLPEKHISPPIFVTMATPLTRGEDDGDIMPSFFLLLRDEGQRLGPSKIHVLKSCIYQHLSCASWRCQTVQCEIQLTYTDRMTFLDAEFFGTYLTTFTSD